MTKFGRCMRCRTRTVVTLCKVEAFTGDTRAVEAELCDPCVDKTQRARLTRITNAPERVVVVYQ